ncbi:DUF7659 family protein [Flavonifractor plautii]|jgi:hypothetical protein|uniref:Uncharacterized protein n=1 Tax=Flavonifractor plautii TaxID=292800 RepID=A0A6I2R750_FLAPL|nr:hypothetical protein [Flavonifractor plautii]MSB19102.1 hypothetical protein [Flavonifractor plautii]MSB83206.1 hypothetical protein [Flavonifractor plautii]DAK79602.1 MAG TPA: hypothetical protein [Caudoviricetes sp.]
MNKYKELRDRQQAEVNALPLGFAFGKSQFDEMMRGWGLDPEKDLDKIVSIGAGGYIQKKDRSLMHETFDRHRRERKEAIAADQTGEGFIFDMFLYELNNHEYGYTGDTSEALEALGLTAQEVVDDPRLNRGICKAHQVIMGRDE